MNTGDVVTEFDWCRICESAPGDCCAAHPGRMWLGFAPRREGPGLTTRTVTSTHTDEAGNRVTSESVRGMVEPK